MMCKWWIPSSYCFVQLFCALSVLAPVLSMSVPKHFLQGKLSNADLLRRAKPYLSCVLLGRCRTGTRSVGHFPPSKQRSTAQLFDGQKPPYRRFSSEDTYSRKYPLQTSVLESSNALPCDVWLSPDCTPYRWSDVESEAESGKLRILRQGGPFGIPPPPKIKLTVRAFGRRIEGAIDKEPDMDVLKALRKFGTLMARDVPGEISQFLRTLIPSPGSGQCGIRSIMATNPTMDAHWHLQVTDPYDTIVYSGACLRENMRVDPGYEITLSDNPYR